SAGNAVVYSVDHEPHAPNPAARAEGEPPRHKEDQRHIDFLAEADLVIHDSQYTIAEYPQKTGWGHSPAEWVVDYAVAARARRLALFHHDPLRTDDALDRVVEVCRERARAAGSALQVFAGTEGELVHLHERDAETLDVERLPGRPMGEGPLTILIVDDDATIVQLLAMTLQRDGFHVITANDGTAALDRARKDRPALILLDWHMPGADGIEVTRALRQD